MAGYDQHILDPWLNPKIVNNFDEVDKYKGIAGEMYINKDLEKFGQQEQSKIFNGQAGSTMFANAAKTEGARQIAGAKASQRLGAGAMARAGANPSSAGATLMYDRMLKDTTNKINDRTADQVVGGLPNYLNQAATWANAGNVGRGQQLAAGQAYQNMFTNAVKMRQSNETFTKKKSLWDKIKEGVSFAGDLVGLAAGIGGLGSMMGGKGGGAVSGGGAGGWVDPNQSYNWTG